MEYVEEGMDMPVVCDESEVVYVSSLAKFAHDARACSYLVDWLVRCMLPWLRHKLLLSELSSIWRNATNFERRHWTEPDTSYIFGWQNREAFLVPPEERRRLYVATPTS